MNTVRRSEWPAAIGGFALGLLIALLFAVLWIMVTRGSAESFDVTITPRTSAADGGLIGATSSGITRRLLSERKTVRPARGGLTFRASKLLWQDPAHSTFARVAELRGRLDSRALASGDIVVRGLVVRAGDVLLEQNGAREWNYRRVMAPLFERKDERGRKRVFLVTDIGLQNSLVRVKTPERAFAIADLSAQLPTAEFAGPRVAAPRVTIARATGKLVVRDSSYSLVAENGTATFPEGRADFTAQRFVLGDTRIADVDGSFGGGLPGMALRVSGNVEQMRFEDVRFASARVPRTGSAAFRFIFRPIDESAVEVRLTDARMESEGSRASGSAMIIMRDSTLTVDEIDARFEPLTLALAEQLLGDTLPYQGSITGTARGTGGLISFDIETRLISRNANEPILSHITGSARVAASSFELRRLDADVRSAPLAALRSIMPGLPLRGNITGRVLLSGPPEKAPLDLNVRLELATGTVFVDGRLDMTGATPTYDLTGRLLAINLQQLVEPNVPPVSLTARFTLVGSGTKPDSVRARLRMDGIFTGWRAAANDTIHLDARVENGTAHVDRASMKLATMTGSANGSWRFAAPASGSIEYRVAFEPITPFGPYIPAIGDEDASGDVQVAGTVSGETKRVRITGDGVANNFTVGGWSATSLEGKYALILGPPVPELVFDASGRDLRTPTAGDYQTLTAKVRLQSPTFALDVRADRVNGAGGIEIVADGRIPPTGPREVLLQRARIDLGSSNWALAAPASFSWAPPRTDLDVRGFELRSSDGNGMIKLEGRVLPLANADFHLETIALPVGDIQRLLGKPARVSGALATNTSIRTVDGIPQLTTRFQLNGAEIENVRLAQLEGNASYQGQTLIANATVVVDTASRLQVNAELPVELRIGPDARVKLLDTGPVRATIISDSIALAPFAALHPDIEKLTGSLAANVSVTGTIQAPVLAGSLSLHNGGVRVIPLNQQYDSINASIVFENRRATIEDLIARSGGLMRATGTIEFEELNKPFLDITARFSHFKAVGMDNQTDAAASGEVRLRGPTQAAVLTGRVRVEEGFMPIPQTGTRALDAELAQFERELPETGAPEPQGSFYRSLRIDDFRVAVGPNLWFAMEDARAELAGELTINKNGDALSIVGELNGERGTYTLRAGPIIRRFDVVSAKIRFLGGRDINPALDISARRRVVDLNGQQFDIAVNIRGTMERPTLALASEEQRAIPQSELLSFLLFGRPSVAIGGTTLTAQKEIGETYIGGIAELLSMELEQAFIDQMGMGLDIFQIRLGGGRLSNLDRASLVVGEEIGSNLFLTVESGVETLFGGAGGTAGATSSAAATFAIRLEWAFARNTNVRASYEPVNQSALLRNYSPNQLPERQYQARIELRRRWTW